MQEVNEIFRFMSPKQLTTLDNKTLREEAATTLANLYPHDLEKDELAVEIENFKYSVIVRCMMDSSRSAQRAVIKLIASQIYRRMKEVYGEQCLARCTIFRWYQRYEAGSVNIEDLPRPG
ncbi:hypothetical protein AVEN_37667-1 [Araneus ventricosus]|uniref:Mos1 transposase HTH domain-containing protein n=1 Tax=Araneus ventricosus TaxID=182803 RepID=A0A4Y2DBR4_ARAVE|nr:hypothetical protein AVEN_37667-1 [Araneus ventricosus]